MKRSGLAALMGGIAAVCLVPVMSQEAHAFSLSSDWSYSNDALGDGSGGSTYDIRGIAMRLVGDELHVALNSNLAITGTSHSSAADGNIGWGDLFFNFTGKSFNEAQGSLFGVRFAGTNDSAVAVGVYSDVRATSVTSSNYGYSSLNQYYNAGFDRANTMGSEGLTTQLDVLNYFGGSGPINNTIGSGNRIGDVTMLSASLLSGLNFGSNAGSQTFGFSINRNLLPSGSFLSNVFLECGNDGVAIQSEAVPEPATMAGAVLGLAGLAAAKRKQRRKEAAS
ncbi:PEP-CTERM sorting domain-containing protein [Pantanalinema sp. GBBB05]|uniref:PEP-CTERM sorting domain-containing protein n=1 Tax=Pantanalinema sp. GBBB05 TaxID=2604139 RepID=UPI001E0A5B83|nr:PEP-CTERM sorting domain-containing protein [Pantanalinema sp. GBBB05]